MIIGKNEGAAKFASPISNIKVVAYKYLNEMKTEIQLFLLENIVSHVVVCSIANIFVKLNSNEHPALIITFSGRIK